MHDPFNRVRLPAEFDREGRVRLCGEAAEDLLAGRLPSAQARMFLGAAVSAWLQEGGSLDRDHLRVVKAKSHRTPAVIWQQLEADRLIRMSDSEGEGDDDAAEFNEPPTP